jgi:hypothetical protein
VEGGTVKGEKRESRRKGAPGAREEEVGDKVLKRDTIEVQVGYIYVCVGGEGL